MRTDRANLNLAYSRGPDPLGLPGFNPGRRPGAGGSEPEHGGATPAPTNWVGVAGLAILMTSATVTCSVFYSVFKPLADAFWGLVFR